MMSRMKDDIKRIWQKQESAPDKQVLREQISCVPGLQCFIGLIGYTGARTFQIELDSSVSVHNNFIRKFRGLEIQVIPVSSSRQDYTIILLDRELKDLFVLFIEDLIEKLIPVTDTIEALTIINQRVNYWKKLFLRVSGELLSAEKQRGLYGELFFLRTLLVTCSDRAEILSSWRGPLSSNQDFARNRNAVEIKTTKASNSSVHIANEQQLDFTCWDNLFLVLLVVSESSGNVDSLCAIINEISDLLSFDPELIQEFDIKLESSGISRDMVEHYDETSYSVNQRRFFRIREEFPVIVRANLGNDALFNVKYQLDLSACYSFETTEEEVLTTVI